MVEELAAQFGEQLSGILPGPVNMPWEVRKIRYRHRMVAFYLAVGIRQVEIAKELQMTPEHISRIANSPLVQAEVQALQEQAGMKVLQYRMEQIVGDAVEVAYDVMMDVATPPNVRISAAFNFLHQIHGKPTQRVHHDVFDYAELLGELDRMKREGMEDPIDITPEDKQDGNSGSQPGGVPEGYT
jgi:hypothetical protein